MGIALLPTAMKPFTTSTAATRTTRTDVRWVDRNKGRVHFAAMQAAIRTWRPIAASIRILPVPRFTIPTLERRPSTWIARLAFDQMAFANHPIIASLVHKNITFTNSDVVGMDEQKAAGRKLVDQPFEKSRFDPKVLHCSALLSNVCFEQHKLYKINDHVWGGKRDLSSLDWRHIGRLVTNDASGLAVFKEGAKKRAARNQPIKAAWGLNSFSFYRAPLWNGLVGQTVVATCLQLIRRSFILDTFWLFCSIAYLLFTAILLHTNTQLHDQQAKPFRQSSSIIWFPFVVLMCSNHETWPFVQMYLINIGEGDC